MLEDGVIYHTYSAYARGLDGLWGMYQWLDRAPRGATRPASGAAATTSTTRAERLRVGATNDQLVGPKRVVATGLPQDEADGQR